MTNLTTIQPATISLGDNMGSDHHILQATFPFPGARPCPKGQRYQYTQWNFQKASWRQYYNRTQAISEINFDQRTIEEATQRFNSLILHYTFMQIM